MFAKCLIPKRILANTLFKRNLPILNKHLSTVNSSNEQTPNVHILDNTRFSKKFARTHYCGQLNSKNEGEQVTICGWIQTTRFKNFLILRDIKGLVQVVFDDEFLSKNGKLIEKLNEESVVSVRGTVIKRPTGQSNPKMNTGEIEVKCDYLEILNESKQNLPFTITDLNRPNETVRLKYRYLDLRFKKMQENLILRSNFVHKVRQFMQANNFLDIETPTLFRRTPGGAREFIVPTNKSGQFYCLTQSPQQFKQLLMVAGFERYYQVARCYRDENSKPDRQPEFTQIDIEMSFINENDIINLIENLIQSCWPFDTKPVTPFNKMKFDEAMNSYGVDKPDVRFDMKLNDVTNLVKESKQTGILKLDSMLNNEKFHMTSIRIPAEFGTDLLSLKEIEKLYKSVYDATNFFNISDKDSFNFMIMKNDQSNHLTKYMSNDMTKKLKEHLKIKENDILILLASNSKLKSLEILGKLRLILADLIDSKNVSKHGSNAKLLRDPKEFNFLWVVDFPLFTRNEETNKLESSHHPFTAPINEHLNMVKESKDLDSVIGLHYDLVLNGSEIAGGSIRIHNSDLQKHVLKNILEENTSQLDHLIEALEYGAPPHGGIAIGLDRLIAILCGTPNIRNVIAFPKNQSGKDLMSSAPNIVSQEELDFYKIKIIQDNK